MITRRARRWWRNGVAAVTVVLVLLLLVGTWHFTGVVESTLLDVVAVEPSYDLEVLSVDADAVILPRTDETARPGQYGLSWPRGYARVGEIVTRGRTTVERALLAVEGDLTRGTMVDFDTFALRSDPADLGLSFDQIVIPGPLGDYPAWELPGTDDTWVVFVHDRGTSRREALRLLFSVNLAGYPSLVITYRNDKGAPASQAGRHALGEDEWEDLEAAVDHVLISGGVDVVIVGHGMGTALASTFVHNSELGHRVQGLIFDAPLLQPGVIVDDLASERGIPGFVSGWAKAVASWRWGVDWGAIDQVFRAEEFETPILMFHGTEDGEIPIRSSDEFAAAAADVVTYTRVARAGHGQAWNVGARRYEAAVAEFLDEVAAGPSDLDPVDPSEVSSLDPES